LLNDFFIGIGILAILLSAFSILKNNNAYYYGMALPLILLGLVQLTIGIIIYKRSPDDIIRVDNYIIHNKEKIITEEIPRMKKVMKNFALYRTIEIVCMLAGIFLMFAFRKSEFVQGLGLGLLIQAFILFILDQFAEMRGNEYLKFLTQLN
jgi:predicted membrane channel-forming protein YqfA (hemolysin III family)